jgi:FKBP-type peptidyl-prolyl cis-trans isomerase
MKIFSLLLFVLFVIISGCSSKKTGVEITTPSGLKYIDEVIGTGPSPKMGNFVTVYYTGKLTNGKTFDSTIASMPYTFQLGVDKAIKGWEEGLLSMKVGGKRRLIIPPQLAYGEEGIPSKTGDVGIPPNSTLIFEVELLAVK